MKWIFLIFSLNWISLYGSSILVLTKGNFNATIRSDKPILVKFYAPWCTNSKELAPEYEMVANEVNEKKEPFIIAEIDGTVYTNIIDDYDIKGFPTILLFVKGTPILYNGPRKAKDILAFIRKKAESCYKELKSEEELKEQINGQGRRCILVSDNKNDIENFSIISKLVNDYNFFYVSQKIGARSFKDIKDSAVIILRDFGEKQLVYSDSIDKEHLIPFLRDHQFDYIMPLNEESTNAIFLNHLRKGIILIAPKGGDSAVKEIFTQLAESRQSNKLLFAEGELGDPWARKYVDYFEIYDKEAPIIELVDNTKEILKRTRFHGNINLQNLQKFLDENLKKESISYLRSESIPKDNTGPVFKVVSKTYKSEVIDNDYDVIVKFYTDRCAGCPELAKTYASLAELMKENEMLKFTKIHGMKNELDFFIDKYPLIYLYPAGKKETPIKFTGKYTKEDIAKFLKDECTNSIELPEELIKKDKNDYVKIDL